MKDEALEPDSAACQSCDVPQSEGGSQSDEKPTDDNTGFEAHLYLIIKLKSDC